MSVSKLRKLKTGDTVKGWIVNTVFTTGFVMVTKDGETKTVHYSKL